MEEVVAVVARPSEKAGIEETEEAFKQTIMKIKRLSVGCLSVRFLGIEVAGSVHHGKWDDEADNHMTIWAVDGLDSTRSL